MEKFYSVLGNILEFVINNYSDEIVYFVLAGVISLGVWLLSKVNNAMLRALMEKALVAVQVTQQSLVDDLKAKSADGKLDADERKQAAEHAEKVFFEQIGIFGKFVYTLIAGPLDKWFARQKDFILAEIKKKSSTIAPSSSPNSGQ